MRDVEPDASNKNIVEKRGMRKLEYVAKGFLDGSTAFKMDCVLSRCIRSGIIIVPDGWDLAKRKGRSFRFMLLVEDAHSKFFEVKNFPQKSFECKSGSD